ncbi:MAG TPA: hypothetical protein VNI56_04575 [Xanthomonadaceae bacterium]|nr:hypothetical protein [Xanthomonadaceae bacterium]
MNPRSNDAVRRGNRMRLAILALVFLGTAALAVGLRLSGWQPSGTRVRGELLQSPGDLRSLSLVTGEGDRYAWNPSARVWRIAIAAPDCAGSHAGGCAQALDAVDKVWRLTGRHASRVHVLWIGTLPTGQRPNTLRAIRPDPKLLQVLPRSDVATGPPVYVIDPNGFVVLRYAPGFDPADLRTDLARLLKLR